MNIIIVKFLLECDFLIDTWFTESVVSIVDKNNSLLLKIIEIYELKEVNKSERIKIWDWSYAHTLILIRIFLNWFKLDLLKTNSFTL